MRAPYKSELAIINSLRPEMERLYGSEFATFEVVGMTRQTVAGAIYQVKIKVDNDEYIHVKIAVPLPNKGEPFIIGFKSGVGENDEFEW